MIQLILKILQKTARTILGILFFTTAIAVFYVVTSIVIILEWAGVPKILERYERFLEKYILKDHEPKKK